MKTALKRTLTGALVAANTLLSTLGCYKDNDSLNSFTPVVQEEYSPQEQTKADNVKIWYEKASLDNIIDSSEMQELSEKAEVPYKSKQGAISLAQLASEMPDSDVNKDGKTDIFDLLYLLKNLSNGEACDVNKDGKTDIFDLITLLKVLSGYYDTYLIKGQHFDNDTETGKKAVITIDGKEYATDINGYFNGRAAKKDSIELTARQIDDSGNFTGFKRTEKIPGMDIDTLKVYSVSYPTQENVTPEQLKALVEEGNADDGFIKFYNEGNMKYVILTKSSDEEQDSLTTTQQDYLENFIRERIFKVLKFEIPIEKKDTKYVLVPSEERKGNIYIEGSRSFGVGTTIENNVIVEALCLIYKPSDYYVDQILAETLSPVYMPFEIENNDLKEKSIFHHASWLPGLQEIDIKAYNLCKRFKGQHLDNVLNN